MISIRPWKEQQREKLGEAIRKHLTVWDSYLYTMGGAV